MRGRVDTVDIYAPEHESPHSEVGQIDLAQIAFY